MSISQNFPEEGPTLNLNFAGSRTLDPRITFTRTQTTSNGSTYTGRDGLIKYAGPNEPRFDHRYVNGEIESLGLLIEEQRSNLFPTSETFVSGWGGAGTTNTDTILNPYGVLGTVYYITTDERYRTFNATGYSTLAFSFFTKKRFGGLERDYTRIQIFQVAVGGGSLATYDFKFDGNNPDGTYVKDIKTEEYPNGWYRFSCRLIARPDYNGGVFSTSTRVDIEGGVSDNYVWGLQVEAASFATSYIPTENSTKTRTADNASISGSNFTEWYNQSEGSVFISYVMRVPNIIGTNHADFAILSSNNNSRIVGWSNDGKAALFVTYADGIATFLPTGNALVNTTNIPIKKIIALKSSDMRVSANGILYTGDLISGVDDILPTDFNRLIIGYEGIFAGYLNGTIAQLTYYPTRLPNSQLVSLTR